MKIYFFSFLLAAIFLAPVSYGQTLSIPQAISVLCTPVPTILVSATSTAVCSGFTTTLTAFGANTYTWTGTTFTGTVNQPTIATGPGTYTVAGTNSAGCTDQTMMFIGIAPPLNIQVTQSSATTCIASNYPKYSKPVNLAASGAATYVWFPYNPNMPPGQQTIAKPAVSTCYTVVGQTSSCSGSAVVCVNVIPQFSINVAVPFPVMCRGAQHQLSVANIGTLAAGPSSAFTYSWTEPLNAPPVSMSSYFASAVLIFPQNTCTYSVEVYDAKGCASLTESVTITVLDCTGLTEKVSDGKSFQLYPNPVKDQLHIKTDLDVNATIELRDIFGKEILKQDLHFNGTDFPALDLQRISPGIYIIQIYTESEGTQILRIIRE